MSKSMQIAIVLDCSNVMRGYVDRFKKEIGSILKTIQKQRNGAIKVALVKYIRTDDDTKIQHCNFTDNLHKIPELIPTKYSTASEFEPKSLKPTDIHTALGRALHDLDWTIKSSRRILILIGKNPPHGIKYHKFGRTGDKYPNGTLYTDDLDILTELGKNKIDLYMISIQKSLYQFHDEVSKLANTEPLKCNLKYVHYINVENENELIKQIQQNVIKIKQIQQNVIKIKQNRKKHEEHKTNTERVEEDLLRTETKETEPDVAVGEMKWIMNEFNKKWCPVLILSTTSKSVGVWDGEKEFKATIERLKERNYDKHDNEAMPIFHKLLTSSLDRHKAYESERTECREIQKKISSNLQCSCDNIKWLNFSNRSWYPVLIVQRSPKMFVLDKDNNVIEVREKDELKNEPPYRNAPDIGTHIKRLNDICSNYQWKSPIGAQCSWKDGQNITITGWKDNIRTGIIESVKYAYKRATGFIVRPDDATYHTILLSTDKDQFKILDVMGYKERMTSTKKRLKSIESDNKSLKLQLEGEERKRKQLNNELNRVNQQRNTLRNDINQYKKRMNSLEEDNDHLSSRITKNKRDIESKTKELEEVQDECSKAITMKQDSERKFKTILKNYDNLKLDAEKLRKQKEKQQQLVNKLRDKKIEDSSALDLSRGFPPIQDIVRDFGLVKSQYHVEAAKLIKKILKKKNQNYSKLRNYKITSNMLFDILTDSFEEMKKFEQEQFQKMIKGHEIDDVNQKKAVEKKMKEMYVAIINEVKKAKAQKIVNKHKELQELNGYLEDDNILLKYAEECISICWVIVLVRDPHLTIDPQEFDQSENDIKFDEKLHIEGFGSDTENCLNFVIWPSIFREDTKYNISRMTGVFIEVIPKWSRKHLKKIEKQKNEKKEQKKKKKNEMEEKSKDNIINGIDNETPKTNIEKENNNNVPHECGDDINDVNIDANDI